MKIRTVKYIVKEGFINSYRNKLMSLASISIITATLLIFGIFYILIINLNYNIKTFQEQPELEAFCYTELNDEEVYQVKELLAQNDKIKSIKMVTREEAFEKLKEMLDNNEEMLEGYTYSIMPVSFIINVKDPADTEKLVKEIKGIFGIESVRYSKRVIDILDRINSWVRWISTALVSILLTISIFIMSNTIKLTVFARRKEINIMKYIGATDWFIRWPFVVEGVIIGITGAVLAFIILCYGYSSIEVNFQSDVSRLNINFISIASLKEIALRIFAILTLIGILVGSLGSVISVRRHLKV